MADELGTGLLLFVASRAAEQRAMQAVADAGLHDITTAQARVLQRVRAEGSRLTELARGANMTPQAMGELVDELVEMEYVVRRPDPTDGRAKLIVLTEKGHACVAAGIATIATLEESITAMLGERGHRELRRLLQRLLEQG